MINVKTFGVAAVGAAAIGLGSFAAPAKAAVIGFDSLNGANETPYAGSTEAGFTVTPTAGQFFQAQFFGNPVPSIFGGPNNSPVPGTIRVASSSNALFFFNSVDLSSNGSIGSSSQYSFTGSLGGAPQYGLFGTLPSLNSFTTIAGFFSSTAIDELFISLTPDSGTISFNIDNINVDAAPIPTPALLPGLLGMGIAAMRKRKCEQAEQGAETAEV